MAVDVNIDSIIRRNLAMRKLPLHYYTPTLVMAKRGLEEMHFDALQKVKIVTLDLDELLKADLPDDFVEEISVGWPVGDKVRPLGYNHRLNKIEVAEAFDQQYDIYAVADGYGYGGMLAENVYNEYLGYKGRNFGRPVTWVDSYTINREEGFIRLDNKTEITEIQLVYLSMPEKVSDRSVIHPFAQDSLHNYINWQWAVYNNDKDQELRRRDFYNSYRILRARKNKMTTTEVKRIIRNKFGLSVKN